MDEKTDITLCTFVYDMQSKTEDGRNVHVMRVKIHFFYVTPLLLALVSPAFSLMCEAGLKTSL